MPHIRPATLDDAASMAAIYNVGIAERIATFEVEPRRPEDMTRRVDEAARFPLLVSVDAADRVVGWAGLSQYRPRACYAGIAEVSIYLEPAARGRGAGRALLSALVDAARDRGFWKILSRVFTFNTASRAMCHACGFREVGVYERHGQLDGRWLDVVIVERLIPENINDAGRVPAPSEETHP